MTTDNREARCGIYANRPLVCQAYPKVDHHIPEECTYTFMGNERRGQCGCRVGACCSTPRDKGEPGGIALPEGAGGFPCKYLVWIDREVEKQAEESLPCSTRLPTADDYYRLVEDES